MDESAPLVASTDAAWPRGLRDVPRAIPPTGWPTLALLLALTLLPRMAQAWHWDLIWSDTITYLDLANALERGDHQKAFGEFGLNIYPVLVNGFRQFGAYWLTVGETWSVVLATLAVLPLWGWVRRQFNDRVALVACLLYAFQPPLVAFAPLIIRDATFWFLFNSGLYCVWRAAETARLRWYLAAGAVLTLAVHTRSEGWFLLAPLAVWSGYRAYYSPGVRRRVVGGAAVAVAMIPAAIALVNLTVLRDAPRWEIVRPSHAAIALKWLGFPVEAPAAVAAATPGLPVEPRRTAFETVRKLGTRLQKTFTYSYGLMALLGIAAYWRIYRRLEHQALLAMSVLLLVAVWMLYLHSEIDIRYLLPIVIAAMPWMALGALNTAEWFVQRSWFARWSLRHGWPERRQRGVALAATLVLIVFVGLFDTKLGSEGVMRQQVGIGRWIRERLGENRVLLGSMHDERLVAYFAEGSMIDLRPYRQCCAAPLYPFIHERHPAVILLWRENGAADGFAPYADLIGQSAALGYSLVPKSLAPANCPDVQILLRRDEFARLQESPTNKALPIAQRQEETRR